MASTYTPIETKTLVSNASSVAFVTIPSTYTDLVLVINGSSSSATSYVTMNFNSDTGSNYSRVELAGNGTSASSGKVANETTAYLGGSSFATSTAGAYNTILNFQNYSNTTTYKTVLSRQNNVGNATQALVNLWRSTAAINRIEVFASWATGSTFTLYGIKAA